MRLADNIQNASRVHPIVVISDLDGEEVLPGLGEKLAYDLAGLAQVYSIELKALMTHLAGANLRNRYSHGLMSDRELASPATLAVWWLVLRIVLRPFADPADSIEHASSEPSEATADHPN
ncbi:DUF4209 domain-containing protein [Xanthomonas euroxanthea]